MVHASTPVCRASNVRRRRYKSSTCGTRFHPSVQGVQHEACAWAENYGFIQKIVALHLQPHWQKLHAHLRGAAQRVHASMDSGAHWDAWTWPLYRDYSDLPSDTWKQTARSLWLAMLSERGVRPPTADQIKFDVFVTSLQDAPAWLEQKKLEKAECASQKEASADVRALGLGPSSLERRKHTLDSYLMRPNAVDWQPSTGTWRPTSGPAPQQRCKAPGGTCYAPVPKNCSKGICTQHCLSFQIAYAQRFATCTPCKYKKSGVGHRHRPRATDATELPPLIGDWQGHFDEPRWRHVAQDEKDENQDSDTSSVIDENPLAQPETLTQPQTFSARAPRTQDLPPDNAEEETGEAYLEGLLGSAPRRNSLPRRLGDTSSEDADFAEAQTANLLDDLQQPPPAERRPSADSGRYIMDAPKKNYHCIVSYCFLLNTAVLPCGHTICTDCAERISRCPLDRTVFVAANNSRNRAVQDAVQPFLLSEGARTAGAILAAAGAAVFSLGSTTRPLTNPDAMQQARLLAFMHLLPPEPPGELAADSPGEPAACYDSTCSQIPAPAVISRTVASLDSERLGQREWKCTTVQRRMEGSEQPRAAVGTLVHVMFNDGLYEGLAGGGTVEFGDGTRFPWSRDWHAARDH